jgi:hypothetical protein
LDRETGFQWIGEVDITADELMAGECKASRLQEAISFLKEILAEGELAATEIYAMAEGEDIKKKTLLTAKNQLGVKSIRKDNRWYWQIQ